MASEINDLTNKTTPVSTDEVEIQETGGGTSYKATLGNLAKGMGDLAQQDTVNNSNWSGTDLSVANGGTGASTLTSGNFLQGNGTSAVTATKAVPAGAVVGTTDTQTLTNKTITPESWITPTLDNSWEDYGSSYNTIQYYKTPDGVVHLKGLAKNGSSASASIFTLPVGYRPAGRAMFAQYASGGLCRIDISNTTGAVFAASGGSTSYTSLDGICFRADN